jgi:2-phosphosulfolactate phosphatase
MDIRLAHGIAGAATATGATVVIDVFRAFSAAAYAFAVGADEIFLAEEVDEAQGIAAAIRGSVLMGEVSGVRPNGFTLGNSPGEIVDSPDTVKGKPVVHRSSAGTRCARAALAAGAGPLYVASLVVASATAAVLANESAVTIVASGESGVAASVEDEVCAEVIAGLLRRDRSRLRTSEAEISGCARAATLRSAAFAHADDVDLCAAADRFAFAMRVVERDGLVRVHRVEV